MRLRIPRKLCKGDCIGIIAPGSPASSPEKIERGVRYIESLGYTVMIGKSVEQLAPTDDAAERTARGYLAASDAVRAIDLMQMFSNKQVRAIFCTRGGYGTPRLLPLLNYASIRNHYKIFVGYSDVTALQLAFLSKCRMLSFAGPMVAVEMQANMDAFTEAHFWETLTEPKKEWSFSLPEKTSLQMLSSKRKMETPHAKESVQHALGHLIGGNLAMLTSMLGTTYFPQVAGPVLFLEDVGEKIYRIDRMFAQLRNAGVLREASAILLGSFTEMMKDEPSLSLEEVMRDYFAHLAQPVIAGFPFGHASPKVTLPIGAMTRVDANTLTVSVQGKVVQ